MTPMLGGIIPAYIGRLDIGASIQPSKSITYDADFTIEAGYGTYFVTDALTVTLPDATLFKDVRFQVKKKLANDDIITLETSVVGQTIDASATVEFNRPLMCLTVQSDGSDWWVV